MEFDMNLTGELQIHPGQGGRAGLGVPEPQQQPRQPDGAAQGGGDSVPGHPPPGRQRTGPHAQAIQHRTCPTTMH